MKKIMLLFCFTIPCIAMDVDTDPVPTKKRPASEIARSDTAASSSSSSVSTISSNTPLASSDTLILSEAQKERFNCVKKMAIDQNNMYTPTTLTYPGTSQRMDKAEKERIRTQAKEIAKNRELVEQNTLRVMAIDAALRLNGSIKDDDFEQRVSDLAKLTIRNDAFYTQCTKPTQEPPHKKIKQ